MTAPTREQVVEWARDADGLIYGTINGDKDTIQEIMLTPSDLERFAAPTFAAGQAAEREACAKGCEDFADGMPTYDTNRRFAAYLCANLIRKRGEK